MVAYNHAGFLAGYPDAFSVMLARGHIAVDLFFLLSGFVLARTYETRMPSARKFLELRYRRLWLPVAVGVSIGALGFWMAGRNLGDIWLLLSAGLLIIPYPAFSVILNPPAWTVFYELLGNGLHALTLQRMNLRGLFAVIGISASSLIVWDLLGADSKGLNVGQGETFFLGLPRLLMSYCFGIALYRLYGDRPRFSYWWGLLGFPIVVVVCGYVLPFHLELLIALTVNPLVVLAALSLRHSRIAEALGALSYPIYAIHFPLQFILIAAGWQWFWLLPISLLVSGCLGVLADSRSRRTLGAIISQMTVRPVTIKRT